MTSPNSRVHIIGLGLLGGSLAAALTRAGYVVSGSDLDASLVDAALAQGIVVPRSDDADLVVVATSPLSSIDIIRDILKDPNPHLVVTDLASVKVSLCDAISDPRYVPGHPMAGSALRAPAGWDATMFSDASWILTARTDTSPSAIAAVEEIVAAVGARVHHSDAVTHDQLVALTSHVPYLLAVGLRSLLPTDGTKVEPFIGPAFRGATRVADANQELFSEIVALNRDAIDSYVAQLTQLLSRHAES
jgi:prephenate dehydrogenase